MLKLNVLMSSCLFSDKETYIDLFSRIYVSFPTDACLLFLDQFLPT